MHHVLSLTILLEVLPNVDVLIPIVTIAMYLVTPGTLVGLSIATCQAINDTLTMLDREDELLNPTLPL